MQTPEDCRFCEKIHIMVQTNKPVHALLELPNTFDAKSKKYTWKSYGPMGYSLIPRAINGKHADVDFFICIDEDDLDDIDVLTYAEQFFKKEILPHWANITSTHFAEPILAPHENIECYRAEHFKV